MHASTSHSLNATAGGSESDRGRIARNLAWSFLGAALPLCAAVVAIPRLIDGLGVARFGLLSLAWVVVGYFSLFDFGLSRALTQLVSERIGRREPETIGPIVWAGMALMSVLGLVGALCLLAMSPWLSSTALQMPESLRGEAATSFALLAISVPIVILTAGLRGVLEAYERFALVNLVRIPLGALSYLAPLAMLPYSQSLPSMVAVLLVVRAASLVAFMVACALELPALRRRHVFTRGLLKRLLSYGGWMTVSNITGPLLLYLGRFLIAGLISAQAVAWFSTPYDVIVTLLLVPGVLVTALYPALAQRFQSEAGRVRSLYNGAVLLNGGLMLAAAVVCYSFAHFALERWIDAEFARQSAGVARLIAVGVFINSFGHLSQALVQAYGRPDLTAKLHVCELVAYVPYLWFLIRGFGVEGAAVAWVVRVAISTIVLAVLAELCLRGRVSRRP